jgi:hypothetical protein
METEERTFTYDKKTDTYSDGKYLYASMAGLRRRGHHVYRPTHHGYKVQDHNGQPYIYGDVPFRAPSVVIDNYSGQRQGSIYLFRLAAMRDQEDRQRAWQGSCDRKFAALSKEPTV